MWKERSDKIGPEQVWNIILWLGKTESLNVDYKPDTFTFTFSFFIYHFPFQAQDLSANSNDTAGSTEASGKSL